MDKKAKNNLFVVALFAIVIIFSMFFVFAKAHDVYYYTKGGAIPYTTINVTNITEDLHQNISFIINNTNPADSGNISSINLTLPTGVLFGGHATNGTNASQYAQFTFSNTSQVLHWMSNVTWGGINSTMVVAFWFNVTVATPGQYNLTLQLYTNGTTVPILNGTTYLTVNVNDSTAPSVLTWGTTTPANNTNLTASTFTINASATDNYLVDTITFNLFNGSRKYLNWSSNTSGASALELTFTNLSAGIYYINFSANDTGYSCNNNLGNINMSFNTRRITLWDHSVTFSHDASIDEDTAYTFNFTVNNTPFGYVTGGGENWSDSALNITQINITVPSAVNFIILANNNTIGHTANFTNTSTVLSWENLTSGLLGRYKGPFGRNHSEIFANFVFSANISTQGNYTVNVTVVQYMRTKADTFKELTYLTSFTIDVNDTTPPKVPTFSCTPSSVYVNEVVTCACTGKEDNAGGSGMSSTYGTAGYSFTVNPSTAEAGSVTETCSVKDRHGNSRSTTATYEVKSRGSSSPGGGGSGGITWTKTYAVTDEQFEDGFSKAVKAKQRIKVSAAGATHHVGVKSVGATKVTIVISSNPITLELEIGEDAKVDLDNDGYYDLYVILNGIINGGADLTVQSLDEEVAEGAVDGVETSGDIVTGEDEEILGEGFGWWWIVIVIVVLVAIGAGVGLKKKK